MALEAQGMGVHFSTSSANNTSTAARIEEVNSFTGPGGAANTIDISHLLSTAKEFLVGLRSEGEVSFEVNYIATAAMQTKLRESRAGRTLSNIALAFNNTGRTLAAGKCYVSGFSISGSVDNKITANITCIISGPVTWATYTGT